MRVILDTNVIISAFLWAGRSSRILDFIARRKISVYSCPEQIFELQGVLVRPKFQSIFNKTSLDPELIVAGFSKVAEFIESINNIKIIKDDISDNVILSCALSANAEYIVTGDKHLLALKEFRGTKIIKPREFLEKFDS